MIIKSDIIIVGAGLTGLTLAYLLRDTNLSISIIEARDRTGGRIFTKYKENDASIELGATWLGKKHSELIKLLSELGIGIYEQSMGDEVVYEPISTSPPQVVTLPPNPDPSYRIEGGSSTLINALVDQLGKAQIYLDNPIEKISIQGEVVQIKTNKNVFQARKIISTLPPNLLVNSIEFEPELPETILDIAKQTHTWMGESIKVGLTFSNPFWKNKGIGSSVFSNVGPVTELYDHSNMDNKVYGLKGFLNGNYHSYTKEQRLSIILKQLNKYYQDEVLNYQSYEEKVWINERYTYSPYPSHITPHQFNGHPTYQLPIWNDQLIIAGSETSQLFPGYMEGAIRSAQYVFQLIKEKIDTLND